MRVAGFFLCLGFVLSAQAASDVSGGVTNNKIVSLAGYTLDLSAAPQTNQVLTWNGLKWVASSAPVVPTNLSQLTNDTGFITASGSISGSAGSVPWTGVTGRPTALSQFTNDSGFITSAGSISGNAATATNWTGTRQINFVYGGDPSNAVPAVTVHNVWRAHSVIANVTEVACAVDAGAAVVNFLRSDGNAMATVTCNTAATGGAAMNTSTVNAYGYIPLNYGIGFSINSGATAKNVSISIKFSPGY